MLSLAFYFLPSFFRGSACSNLEQQIAGSYHYASPSWAQILLHELLLQQKFMAGARLRLQLDSNFILDYPSQRLAGQWERKGDSLYQ